MTMLTTTNGSPAIIPNDRAQELIVTPLMQTAICFNPAIATATVAVGTEWRAPRLDQDVQAAWVAEGEEIPDSEPTLTEVIVRPSKAAALTPISRELAQDSSPGAQQLVGQSMVNDIARVLNVAFLGNLDEPAPAGLGSVAATEVPLALSNLDSFFAAQSEAQTRGANLTGWILSPADALALRQLKLGTGSNASLLPDAATLAGLPVVVSSDLPAGTAYGVDASRIYAVLRQDVTLDVSEHAYFTSDRVALRTTVRVGFGYAAEASVIKLTTA